MAVSGILRMFRPKEKHDVDMTEGSILRHLLIFAFPLLIGNIFQQLYNMVDTWVVGNFVSNEAYSAVGSVGPIINMLIGFFGGLSGGAGAVISQYYGARQEKNVQRTVHTAMTMTLVMGVLFTAIGIAVTPFMLRMMNTPDEVFGQSQTYLTVYFAGIMGLMIYNIGSGILRAVGDSTRPFYFLVVSALLNTVLDLFFVLGLNMGVEGVAFATILAQGVSAVLVIITLMRTTSCIRFSFRQLNFELDIFAKILKVGLPSALQMAVTSFSNVFVQSYINQFGPDGMSGWTSYAKIDQLILLPMQSVSLASTTFVAQNLGSRQPERAKKGVRTALLLSFGSVLILMLPVMLFAPSMVAFFNSREEVVVIGALLLRFITPFYLLCCINQIYAGALRGAGDSLVPMITMLVSFVAFRQLMLYLLTYHWIPAIAATMPLTDNARLIITAMAYPAGWLLASTLISIYYHVRGFSKSKLIEHEQQPQ